MALGGPSKIVFLGKPNHRLRQVVSQLPAELAARMLRTFRCDVEVIDRSAWTIDDYRAIATLIIANELMDSVPCHLWEAAFASQKPTYATVRDHWDVEPIQFDDQLDANELEYASVEELEQLSVTGRVNVDAWLRQLKARQAK